MFKMDKYKNCSSCNIKLDENNYKKDRTVCKSCYIKKDEKAVITPYSKINNQKTILLTKKRK